MTIIGSGFGGSSDFNLTRNEIIEEAYQDLNVLAEGEALSAGLLNIGIKKLNKIVREHDVAGKHLWGISSTPSTLTLIANQFVYNVEDDGLPSTILSLMSATYRDALAEDHPLDILTTEQYEAIAEKTETGDPVCVYLSEHKQLDQKILFVDPMLSTVNSQSVVTGTDAAAYRCIKSHTADSTNHPVTGGNYLLYWEAGGSSPGTWTTGTSYTAPQHLRLWFKRPLFDFDSAADNPDYPAAWVRYLGLRLCQDLAPGHNVPMERIGYFKNEARAAYESIFRSTQPRATKLHDFTVYW